MPVYTAHQLICHVFHLRSNGIINNTSAFTSLCLIIRRKALMYSLWSPAATFVASATKAGKKEIRLQLYDRKSSPLSVSLLQIRYSVLSSIVLYFFTVSYGL